MKKVFFKCLTPILILILALISFTILVVNFGGPVQAYSNLKLVVQPTTLQTLSTYEFTATPETVTYANTFTIGCRFFHERINSAGAVTSSATTAITSGAANGQLLWIENVSGYNVIVKDGANTSLGGDLTMVPGDATWLHWNGTLWKVLFIDP